MTLSFDSPLFLVMGLLVAVAMAASTSGQVTAAGTVNYLGSLFQISKFPNSLLRLMGATQVRDLGGIRMTTSRTFPCGVTWSTDAGAQPTNLEGANAPTAKHYRLGQQANVVQIFHEKVDVSYLAAGERALSGVVPVPLGEAQGEPVNPRSAAFQVARVLDQIARQVNYSCLRGTYASPADPAANPLGTRGLLTCVTTNAVDMSAEAAPDAEVYKGWVETLVKTVVEANGYMPDETWTILADAQEYNNVQAAYEGYTQAPPDRYTAGFAIRTLVTRFGRVNLVLEPDMPADTVLLANVGTIGLVGMETPGKGILFEEPLSKTGASDATQIYGELGIDHGPEQAHGKLLVPAASAL